MRSLSGRVGRGRERRPCKNSAVCSLRWPYKIGKKPLAYWIGALFSSNSIIFKSERVRACAATCEDSAPRPSSTVRALHTRNYTLTHGTLISAYYASKARVDGGSLDGSSGGDGCCARRVDARLHSMAADGGSGDGGGDGGDGDGRDAGDANVDGDGGGYGGDGGGRGAGDRDDDGDGGHGAT